jgi:hypothetical protein
MSQIRKLAGDSGEFLASIIGCAAVLAFLLAGPSAHAATASASPTACVDNASIGASTWTIGAPVPATSDIGDAAVSHYLVCTGYGFSIPTGSAINGITATVVVDCSKNNQCQDNSIRIVKAGSIAGANHAGNNPTQFWTKGGQTRSYGGAADLWGVAWLATDINAANFGLAISITNKAGGGLVTATVTSISLSVTYTSPPTVAKSFSPATVAPGASSTLTITLTNPNAGAITGVAMADTYPANLVNASTPAGSTTCAGGTVTAPAGGTSVALSGATIPASGSCTVSVSVTSSISGSYNNNVPVGSVTFPSGGFNGGASNTATLTVLNRPAVTKSFGTNPIVAGSTSLLTITLSNSNAVVITGAAFTDTYPGGVTNSTTASTTCGGTATAVVNGGTVSLSGGVIPAGGSCTVTVTVKAASSGSYANSIAVGAVTSSNASSNTLAATDTLTVNPAVATFDAVEAAAAPHTNLYTKLSGVSFSVDILALDSSNAVSASYTGTVSLEIVDGSSSGTCTSMTSLLSLGNQTFTAGNAGRKTIAITYASAARNVRIRINDSILGITTCSFDAFVIRPGSFSSVGSNMTNTATSGTPSVNAGGNFTLTATAIAGYNGTPSVDNTKISAHAGAIQAGTISGVFSAAVPGTGVATGTTFSYGEVGNFQFQAQGVYDDTFTAVDQPNDCTNNFSNALAGGKYGCKFGTSAATSFFGRFTPDNFVVSSVSLTNRSGVGCAPPSVFTYMGEPIGLGFTLTAKNLAGTTTQNYTTASGFAQLNPAAPRYFNFVAKDTAQTSLRTFLISAITRTSPGQVTTSSAHGFSSGQQVYMTGAGGMTQINGQVVTVTFVSPTSFTIGVDTTAYTAYTSGGTVSRLAALTSGGTWTAGVAVVTATVTVERAVTPDGPYTALNVGIAPRDDDGIALLSGLLNFDADNNGGSDSFGFGSTEARFGRMRLGNAFGSTLLALPVPLTVEYYNSSGVFVTNANDSCTTILASDVSFSFVVGTNLNACKTQLSPAGTLSFNSGVASVKLTKPTAPPNDGAVDLTVNLGTLSGNTCVGASSTPATGASKTWLQGNWGTTSFSSNPQGRASFGQFKAADQFIYLREVY